MYHIFFIHLSVDGHLGCVHVLAIVNRAAVNIRIHVFLSNYSFLWIFGQEWDCLIIWQLYFWFLKELPHYFKVTSPGDSDGKESACNAGDLGSFPGWGRSTREGNGYQLQYSCLENCMNRGAW